MPSFLSGTLEELNSRFNLWLEQDYQHKTHSSTGESPFNRFARHVELVRSPPIDLEDHFRKEVRRRVTRDRTVTIEGRLYEAPTKLIGEQVSLLYHEKKPERVEIYYQGQSQGLLRPVDLKVNCQVKRDRECNRLLVEEQTCRQGRLPL